MGQLKICPCGAAYTPFSIAASRRSTDAEVDVLVTECCEPAVVAVTVTPRTPAGICSAADRGGYQITCTSARITVAPWPAGTTDITSIAALTPAGSVLSPYPTNCTPLLIPLPVQAMP